MNEIINILKPILPKAFDKNELFIIVISLLMTGIALYLHHKNKSLLTTEFIAIFLLNLLFSIVGESFLAEPPLDFYDTADRSHAEIADIILQIFVYPPTILIAIQYYSHFKPNKFIFIFICTLLLTFLEFISIEVFNLFQYKKWKLFYSFFFYLFVMTLNIAFYRRFHFAIKKSMEHQKKA